MWSEERGFVLQSPLGCWIASSHGGTGWMFPPGRCLGTASRIVVALAARFIAGVSQQQQLVANRLFFSTLSRDRVEILPGPREARALAAVQGMSCPVWAQLSSRKCPVLFNPGLVT